MSGPGHWEGVYRGRRPRERSWFQLKADVSLALIQEALGDVEGAVLDVGGGASPLAGQLLARGYRAVTVVDVAEPALAEARAALGAEGPAVRWIVGDVLRLPIRTGSIDLWHDRAVFHFLARPGDRSRYRGELRRVLRPGGAALVATFAEDGPSRCSGLRVVRYSLDALHAALGRDLEAIASQRELHPTPNGGVQPFTYGLFRYPGNKDS